MVNRQPTLEGELVELRPTTEDDREPLFALASDPLLWELHPAHDRWQRAVFDRFFDEGVTKGGALTVVERATGRVVGSSRYGAHVSGQDEIEVGWTYLAREHWGGPYNAEMKRLMLDHILRDVGTVTFRVGEDNLRSRRALEKIGAVLRHGTEVRTMAGEPVVHVIYAIGPTRT